MHIAYTEEQERLRAQIRAYYERLLTPDLREVLHREHGCGPTTREVVRQMGRDGWLGIGWPKEWGGQGRSAIEQFIFFDESMRSGAPVPMLTINTVGPTIMQFGSDEQKRRFLPRILAGEIHFCIGYTEPGAGTDLAALRTRADRRGDVYVVNGQKIFTSLAGDADYLWLAARTDPSAPKHAGISILIADTKSPGMRIVPMQLLSQHDINQVFFDDMEVPVGNRVGKENGGWRLITNQLNHERVTLCSPGLLEQSFEETRRFAIETRLADGRRIADQEWVQTHLARVFAGLELLRLLNWKVAWTGTRGKLDVADASSVKTFGTELYLESFRLLMEILGERAFLQRGSLAAVLQGRLELNYRALLILTFGGGTNEIQRDLIGMFGLGLPRAPRF